MEVGDDTELPDYISDQDKTKYDLLFSAADKDKSGLISGNEAIEFFSNSGLSQSTLGSIWTLSDVDKDGELSHSEFRIAMHLIYAFLRGSSLPQVLPNNLIESSKLEVGVTPQSAAPPTPVEPPSPLSSPVPSRASSPAGKQPAPPQNQNIAATNDRSIASSIMKEGFTELERGNIRGALDHVLRAEEILDKNASQRTQELKVCRAYRDALQWLRAMERMNNWNGVSSTSTKKGDDLVKEIWKRQAICARAAAEFTLQPRHRMTAVRMCIQSNLRARNFSIAASFIRLLLPLHTIDEKRLESQLQICQEHMYKDEGLLSYTCPNCKHQVSHAPAVCSVCQAPMDWSYFKSEFIDNLVEVISPPTDLRESGELTETQLVDKMAASTLLASGKSKRDVIAQEIFDSEKKYVESLDLLVQMYMKPMQELPAVKSPQFSAAVKTIFGDIQIIHGFNSLFLSRLEERMNDWNPTQQLGPIFLELVDYMKVYTNYVNNYTLSIVTVTELKKQSQEVANFLENTKKKCQYKDIQSLLIQPIQRLPRYVLLLQELKEATPSNHPDHDPLELAFVKMKVVADYVNEKKREAEDMNSVLIIQDQITYPFSEPEPLIQPHRRFIKQEGVIQLSKKNEHKVRTLFLFNDLLLLVRKVKGDGALGSSGSSTRGPMDRAVSKSAMTRSRRNSTADINQLGQAIYQFKHQFPLGSCVIQEEEEGKVLLRVSRDKVYTFSATSRETWEKFISDLKEAISVIRSAQNSRAAQLKETNSEKVSHDVVSPHDWRLLFATATEMEYPKGTIILTKGSQNFKVFRILRGSIACIINPRCHYDMGEGDLMGGGCIIGENRVEGDMVVQSEGGARVAVIAVRVVRRLLNVEANLAMKVFSTVARDFAIRLRTLEGSHSHPHRAPSTKAMDNISDIEFHHFFPTLKGETLLKTYSGTYKRNVAHQGLIFITHNYLCFHSQIFGFSKKSAVNLGSISNQEASKQTTIDVRCKAPEKREEKTIKYTFNTMQDRDDALNTLTIVKKNHFERGRTDVVEYPSPAITTKASGNSKNPGQFKKLFGKDKPLLGKFMFDSQMEGLPTKDDWVIILKEAKTVTFKKDQVIFTEGDQIQAIYQVVNGSARIGKHVNHVESSKTLGFVNPGDIFGEISFLEKSAGASASVTAFTDLELRQIEGYTLRVLFDFTPGLAGRFYKYLGSVAAKRFWQRITELDRLIPIDI